MLRGEDAPAYQALEDSLEAFAAAQCRPRRRAASPRARAGSGRRAGAGTSRDAGADIQPEGRRAAPRHGLEP